MAWDLMTARQINKRITILFIFVVVFYAGIACAADIDAVSTAAKIEKLGIVGVLALCLIITNAALLFLIRLQYGKMMTVIEKTADAKTTHAQAMTQLSDSLDRNTDSTNRMIEHCQNVHSK